MDSQSEDNHLVCPQCGTPFAPEGTFCGECGQKRPEAPAAAVVPPKPAGSRSVAPWLGGCLVLIVIVGAAGYYFLGRGARSTTARQSPALPQRMAGALTEFPVDTNTDQPARPTSVVQQSFQNGSSTSSQEIPEDWLPPGMPQEQLARQAASVTSATYRVFPEQPAVNVHVLENAPGRSSPGRRITGAIESATSGSRTTGIQVQSPEGELYEGWRVRSNQIEVFILESVRKPFVIVIYAPEPSVHPIAERLATNISNGQGLTDYPEFNNSLSVLPAYLPAGMKLEEMAAYSPADLGLSAGQLSAQLGGAENSETRQLVSQFERFIPQRIVTARYRDASRQSWEVLIGDYESTMKAIGIWFALRLLGVAGMNSVDAAGGSGLWMDLDDEGRILIFRAGSAIVAMKGPSAAPLEALTGLANGLQF